MDKQFSQKGALKLNLVGQILLKKNLVTEAQLQDVLATQKKEGGLIGELFVKLGYISEEALSVVLAAQYGLCYLPLEKYKISADTVKLIPQALARKYLFIPIEKIDGVFIIVVATALVQEVVGEIESFIHHRVVCMFGAKSQIEKLINNCYKD